VRVDGKAALAIPGTPPALEGARGVSVGAPVGPSLDFSVPPNVE
jgi:hypothetical protein